MSKSPQPPKHPRNMTTKEAAEHLFHPEVLEHFKNVKDTTQPRPLKKV